MSTTTYAWPPDEGSQRIPDPGLTLSEMLNIDGVLRSFIEHSRAEGDAVLEAAMEKLTNSAHEFALEHPDEYEMAVLELGMQKRFGLA